MKRLLVSLILLSACNAPPPNIPGESPSTVPSVIPEENQKSDSIFSKALSNRSLSLDLFQEGNNQNAQNGSSQESAATPTAGNATNEMAAGAPAPVADIAQGKMMAPWFGGGEFNQYILQYAEESLFPAIQSTTLLNAYKEMVAPIMLEWDAQARLVESRANLGTGKSEEMLYYLPDVNGSPKQVKINYLFRLASSERKETLVVYMSDENTHVHRMVWGEPNLDISTIKIDSNQARDLALKAFLDSSLKGDNIYPQAIIREEMQVFYEIPDNAHWQIHLNQQGQKSAVYYVHVNFEAKVDMSQSPDLDSPIPPEYAEEMGEDFERERQRELEGIHQMYASAQIDAQSGAIISLDRPSYYFSRYYPGRPMLMTVEPVYEDSDPAAPPALEASKTP